MHLLQHRGSARKGGCFQGAALRLSEGGGERAGGVRVTGGGGLKERVREGTADARRSMSTARQHMQTMKRRAAAPYFESPRGLLNVHLMNPCNE